MLRGSHCSNIAQYKESQEPPRSACDSHRGYSRAALKFLVNSTRSMSLQTEKYKHRGVRATRAWKSTGHESFQLQHLPCRGILAAPRSFGASCSDGSE
mmetsp:Transcript_123397/g.308300  ORF Transcript_123397/g.308300 Transcript_123397/m.308300 type:complete len:98 (+) Transcript_123397:3248-3541(+)